MNQPLTLTNSVATQRFDLAHVGLSDSQLKAIAGARPGSITREVTVAGVTKCCWG